MAKKKIPELKIEWVAGRSNLIYLSLIEFKRETYLCVIDNIGPSEVAAYVLDYAEQEGIDIPTFLSIVTRWFYGSSDEVPLSVSLARQGLTEQFAPIFRAFDLSYVSRIVGYAFRHAGERRAKVKRRRVVPIHEGIEIRLRRAGPGK